MSTLSLIAADYAGPQRLSSLVIVAQDSDDVLFSSLQPHWHRRKGIDIREAYHTLGVAKFFNFASWNKRVAMIARSVVERASDLSIVLLDCNYRHPRAGCRCIACELGRGNQADVLIGSA